MSELNIYGNPYPNHTLYLLNKLIITVQVVLQRPDRPGQDKADPGKLHLQTIHIIQLVALISILLAL